jgi:predicted ATPase
MSSLDKIQVKGFKSIRGMDLELRPLNVLIGANGAGKTNFVSLFKLLNQMVEGSLQVFVARSGGADALLYFGQKNTNEISIELGFGRNGYSCRLIPSANDTLIFAEESCWGQELGYSRPFNVDLGKGHKESKLEEEAIVRRGHIAKYVLGGLKSWKVYHFHDTSDSAKIKQTGDIGDNSALRPDASNLAAFLYLLRETATQYYSLIVETVRLAAPFFDDFNLRPEPLNRDKMKLEWRETGSDAYFNAHALSDGTMRFICLATLLLQPTLPSTILIDEPELGLHPYAITLLASMLRSAATKTQVIISTQSVPLVNQFSPEDIIVVDRENGQSVFRHLETQAIETWLEEYGLGDLWEKNILGGRPQR